MPKEPKSSSRFTIERNAFGSCIWDQIHETSTDATLSDAIADLEEIKRKTSQGHHRFRISKVTRRTIVEQSL